MKYVVRLIIMADVLLIVMVHHVTKQQAHVLNLQTDHYTSVINFVKEMVILHVHLIMYVIPYLDVSQNLVDLIINYVEQILTAINYIAMKDHV